MNNSIETVIKLIESSNDASNARNEAVCHRLAGLESAVKDNTSLLNSGALLHEKINGRLTALEAKDAANCNRLDEHSSKLNILVPEQQNRKDFRTGLLYPITLVGATWFFTDCFPKIIQKIFS